MTSRLLLPSEVADQMRCTTQTVLRWIRHGELRAIRLGGRMVRIDPADLSAFAATRKTGPQRVATTRHHANLPAMATIADRVAELFRKEMGVRK